ncbi:MAG: magnesium transporter [Promethearchaeia archaeon]
MIKQDSKKQIVKETFPAETVSIVGDLLAGVILTIIILPFESFVVLILIVPALLSLRGNLSGPFIARTSRDLIIGEFDKKSWIENVLATYCLGLITATLVGIFSVLINLLIFGKLLLNIFIMVLIPILTMIFTLSISILSSTILNLIVFHRGLDPNNIVNPIMTAVDDFFTVVCFFLTILILGVP